MLSTCFNDERTLAPQPFGDEMVMDGARGEQGGDRGPVRTDISVRKDYVLINKPIKIEDTKEYNNCIFMPM